MKSLGDCASPPTGYVRVGPLQPTLAVLGQFGADPHHVLAQSGLPGDALDDADQKISIRSAARLLQNGADAIGRQHFGLLVGSRFDLSLAGVMGEIVANSPTVGAALQHFRRYFHLQDGGAVPYLRRDGETDVALGYSLLDGDIPGADVTYDAVMAMAMAALTTLCGPKFAPARVFLSRRAPRQRLPYRKCFNAPVIFDAPFSELCFSAHWLGAPVIGAAPSALTAARRSASALDNGESLHWARRARAVMRTLLLLGDPTAANVADALEVHPRTLRRRLMEEGTSLQSLLGEARYDVARELLRQTWLPIADIAVTLSFADATAFIRAFRGWAGCPPGAWRVKAAKAIDSTSPPLAGRPSS